MNIRQLTLLSILLLTFTLSSCDNEPLEGEFSSVTQNPTEDENPNNQDGDNDGDDDNNDDGDNQDDKATMTEITTVTTTETTMAMTKILQTLR
ncbi:hypothetical protein [Mesonia sp.]|uniref:hypothetical protein n=1 Tax=Mesonia sp. TaxID=1960830 RepID=UPI003F9668F1